MSGILILMFGIYLILMSGICLIVMSDILILMSSILIFIWLPFLISWRPTIEVLLLITSFITYPSCVAIHQTIMLQVFLQYSGIRLGHALQFASPTRTSYHIHIYIKPEASYTHIHQTIRFYFIK